MDLLLPRANAPPVHVLSSKGGNSPGSLVHVNADINHFPFAINLIFLYLRLMGSFFFGKDFSQWA